MSGYSYICLWFKYKMDQYFVVTTSFIWMNFGLKAYIEYSYNTVQYITLFQKYFFSIVIL
jgi:hypothetical protein